MLASTAVVFALAWSQTALGVDKSYQVAEPSETERTTRWKGGYSFQGIQTFAHLPHTLCLIEQDVEFDLAIIGVPFDTSVAYRPGARFGPKAIRGASQRQIPARGFNHAQGLNPYQNWATVIDCGDIPVTPFDNAVAFEQMTEAYRDLLRRPAKTQPKAPTPKTLGKDGIYHPRLVTLGGDHSVALPALRALHEIYGPVSVLHFDSHLDTWNPSSLAGAWASEQSNYNHGSMFWIAHNEGLIAKEGNIHAGLRTRIFGNDYGDYAEDAKQDFQYIETEDLDIVGIDGVVSRIIEVVGDRLVYVSIDIDVLEPGLAPGTGCPEPGGWTTRELKAMLRGLQKLNIVGADVVEVAPPYDDSGESTAWAAADLAYELLGLMVGNPPYPVEGYVARKKFAPKWHEASGRKDEL
ncbi:hypothetical protein PV08_05878 [Exophiala spinifera]|uniref:Agmatinase n=1 Tax=Exophiala spinifera TaxID=91928 RepID=A0A0D2BA00_9EURO|nr:uncharacterized protein PV08_05878 [Exophiala spinifera]KIW15828.1 hypothetical protein PV08_05878 [Exophiala spinifera]